MISIIAGLSSFTPSEVYEMNQVRGFLHAMFSGGVDHRAVLAPVRRERAYRTINRGHCPHVGFTSGI